MLKECQLQFRYYCIENRILLILVVLYTVRVLYFRAFDTYESKKHPESPRGLIFFVKFIGYILRDLA